MSSPSLFGAIGRFFTFKWWRQALRIERAANAQFTDSAQGIRDGMGLEERRIRTEFTELRDAVAEVELNAEQRRQRLDELNKQEVELLKQREGALVAIERARAGNDKTAEEKATAAFNRYQERITRIDEEQAQIEAALVNIEKSTKQHFARLTQLQHDLQQLPVETADLVAAFHSNKALIRLNERFTVGTPSNETTPADAIRQKAKELAAQANVSSRIAGTDVTEQDREYAELGGGSSANDVMEQMLAARSAASGGGGATETAPDKPEISG